MQKKDGQDYGKVDAKSILEQLNDEKIFRCLE